MKTKKHLPFLHNQAIDFLFALSVGYNLLQLSCISFLIFFPVNFDNQIGACGFVPILLQKLFPYIIIKLDENGEPVRDPKTGLLVKCKHGEPGELIGKIDKGHPFRDFKG
jgi:hypothetical protein